MAATFGEWRRAPLDVPRAHSCGRSNDLAARRGLGRARRARAAEGGYWYLRRALAPVAVWMTDEGTNGIAVHVANDTGTRSQLASPCSLRGVAESCTAQTSRPSCHLVRWSSSQSKACSAGFADASYAYRFGHRRPEHETVTAELWAEARLLSRDVLFTLGPPATGTGFDHLGLTASAATALPSGAIDVTFETAHLAYAVELDAPGLARTDEVYDPRGAHTPARSQQRRSARRATPSTSAPSTAGRSASTSRHDSASLATTFSDDPELRGWLSLPDGTMSRATAAR